VPAIPPPTVTVPFDSVNDAMDSARVRLNDCPLGLSGNLLANTQPYAQAIYNDAWREFQRDLSQYGDPAQTEEFLSQNLPVVANNDPWTSVYLGQANYFDGVSFYSSPDVNLLPQNLICPIHVGERMAGTINQFTEVIPCDNGIPKCYKTSNLRWWEWRSAGSGGGNAIFMPGATVPRDIYVRFASFLPDAVDDSPVINTPWYNQPLPILRCEDILAYYICAEYAYSRGSEQAKAVANSFWADGMQAMREYVNATTMKIRQRINHRRRSYSRGRHRGWNWW
jgi:hypothetical protein